MMTDEPSSIAGNICRGGVPVVRCNDLLLWTLRGGFGVCVRAG